MMSIVIPLMNEAENLPLLYERLKKVLPELDSVYEIIFIDDGSTDRSLEVLKNLAKKDKHIRIFSFRRNQGKAEALTLGFQKAKGNVIVSLDADLQDRPEEIHKLLQKQKEGYELVCGWRKERKDAVEMKFISRVFNFFTGVLWGINLHDYNCGLKVFTKDAAKSLFLYGGMHRFIPLLANENGFRVTEVAVVHDKRQFGKSKYGFSKIRNIPDMFTLYFLTRYAKRPLHFFATVGSIVFLIGLGIFLYLWGVQIFQHLSIGRRPLFFVSLVMMLAGLQLFFSGFLADLMLNLYRAPQLVNEDIHHFLRFDSDTQK